MIVKRASDPGARRSGRPARRPARRPDRAQGRSRRLAPRRDDRPAPHRLEGRRGEPRHRCPAVDRRPAARSQRRAAGDPERAHAHDRRARAVRVVATQPRGLLCGGRGNRVWAIGAARRAVTLRHAAGGRARAPRRRPAATLCERRPASAPRSSAVSSVEATELAVIATPCSRSRSLCSRARAEQSLHGRVAAGRTADGM